jgi:type VI secretion system protein ImpK
VDPDDPFADLDQDDGGTVIRPSPGGGRRPSEATSEAPGVGVAPGLKRLALTPGVNPLESAAAPLLALMASLRKTMAHPDPMALRSQVAEQVRVFESEAHGLGVSPQTAQIARYLLCTALDEAVLNTPWGSASDWSKHSLLADFHKDVKGGERFFELLRKLAQKPAQNLHLLELMYVCLSLGFVGRYRVMDDGRTRLEDEREQLYRIIRSQRGDPERGLSGRWQGVVHARNPLIRYVPIWVVAAVGGIGLLVTYVGLSFHLSGTSDPVMKDLSAVGKSTVFDGTRRDRQPIAPVVISKPAPAPAGPSVKLLLAGDIAVGLLDISESPSSATIVIRGRDKGLFRSGSATLRRAYYPMFERIADALRKVPGKVLVTGHTDSVPIFTPRYPSNWHLSQARAQAVVKALSGRLATPGRLSGEGRADTEPVAPNDSPAGRARNRRVEILIKKT